MSMGPKVSFPSVVSKDELHALNSGNGSTFDTTDWKTKYQDLYQRYQALGFEFQETKQQLDMIEPVYSKLYNSCFFWFIRPVDADLDGRELMRCNTCVKDGNPRSLFWSNGTDRYSKHKGHRYKRATQTTFWDYMKVRWLGLIK